MGGEVSPWGDQWGVSKNDKSLVGNHQKNIYITFHGDKLHLEEVKTYFDVLLSHEVCAVSSVRSPGRHFVNGHHGFQRVNPVWPYVKFTSEYEYVYLQVCQI